MMNQVMTGTLPDETVIGRVLAGDTALFEILIRRYNPGLYKIARGFGFSHHDAEDLLQETHVAAYQHLAQFGGRAAYKTWLSKIMVHKCSYQVRHGHRRHEQPADLLHETLQPTLMSTGNPQPEAVALNRELAAIIEHSIQQIPLPYRSVFILREIEGFSVADTAAIAGISPTNVKVRLNRAKALLQKEIEQVYSRPEIYSFNLVYCDAIVHGCMERIRALGAPPDGAVS
ncbi:MAG: sigma-70 family RNA polymerase sigma factor [Chitinophagaceae bacterium]|nr:MAG: sigma-70 family RNA polymerase sigma factor [Chitinophagaceae bacterium]